MTLRCKSHLETEGKEGTIKKSVHEEHLAWNGGDLFNLIRLAHIYPPPRDAFLFNSIFKRAGHLDIKTNDTEITVMNECFLGSRANKGCDCVVRGGEANTKAKQQKKYW